VIVSKLSREIDFDRVKGGRGMTDGPTRAGSIV